MTVEELEFLREKEIKEKFDAFTKIDASKEGFTAAYEIFKSGYLAAEPETGNQYTGYLKEGNKTLEKVNKDEPIFVLRAQDNTAPGIVLNWIAKNLDTVEEFKLKEVYQTVLAMRRYSFRRDPT